MVKIYNIQVDTRNEEFLKHPISSRLSILEKHLATIKDDIGQATGILDAVIVAPENVFAKSCKEDTVEPFDITQRNEILVGLADLSKKYPNILIIPGTLSWKEHILSPHLEVKSEGQNEFLQDQNLTAPLFEEQTPQRASEETSHLSILVREENLTTFLLPAQPLKKHREETTEDRSSRGHQQANDVSDTQAKAPAHTNMQQSSSHVRKTIKRLPTVEDLIRIGFNKGNSEAMYNAAFLYLGGVQIGEYYKKIEFAEDFPKDSSIVPLTRESSSIFFIPQGDGKDQLTLGLEIGFEHRTLGLLKKEAKNNPLDIHVVLAAQPMGFNQDNICSKENGKFVLSSSFRGRSTGAINLNPDNASLGLQGNLHRAQAGAFALRVSSERESNQDAKRSGGAER